MGASSLSYSHRRTSDHLIWTVPNAKMPIRVKDIYVVMISPNAPSSSSLFPSCFWKSGCPLKLILFSWLVFNNRNLSWKNLRRRSWQGPSDALWAKLRRSLTSICSSNATRLFRSGMNSLYFMVSLTLFLLQSRLPSNGWASKSTPRDPCLLLLAGAYGSGEMLKSSKIQRSPSSQLCSAFRPFMTWFLRKKSGWKMSVKISRMTFPSKLPVLSLMELSKITSVDVGFASSWMTSSNSSYPGTVGMAQITWLRLGPLQAYLLFVLLWTSNAFQFMVIQNHW